MTDKNILEIITNENGTLKNMNNLNPIIKNNNELKKYLETRFEDSFSYKETIYRILNNIEIVPVCRCGKKVKFNFKKNCFNSYCSMKCQNSDPLKKEKTKLTKLEKYGDENYNNIKKQIETNEIKYGVKSYFQTKNFIEKAKQTNIKKYGVEWWLQTKECKIQSKKSKLEKYGDENYNNREKANETCLVKYGVENPKKCKSVIEKDKNTCLLKYGVKSYTQTEEYKQKVIKTNLERYGEKNCTKNKEWVQKWYSNEEWVRKKTENIYSTMLKNQSFKKSKPELIILNFLKKNYPDIIYQYKDENYPFKCDYYIPSKKLYIEYNGFWHHGGHFFDKNNIQDIEKLRKWENKKSKMYDSAIKTWTIRDVEKLKVLKDKNLNYIILWYEDFKNLNKIKEMVDNF